MFFRHIHSDPFMLKASSAVPGSLFLFNVERWTFAPSGVAASRSRARPETGTDTDVVDVVGVCPRLGNGDRHREQQQPRCQSPFHSTFHIRHLLLLTVARQRPRRAPSPPRARRPSLAATSGDVKTTRPPIEGRISEILDENSARWPFAPP